MFRTNSVAIVVEEIKPRHDAVLGWNRSPSVWPPPRFFQLSFGRFRDFVRVNGAFKAFQ